MKKVYKASVKDETLFFIKNSLDNNLLNIEFDMFMQYPSVMAKYLTDVKPYDSDKEK